MAKRPSKPTSIPVSTITVAPPEVRRRRAGSADLAHRRHAEKSLEGVDHIIEATRSTGFAPPQGIDKVGLRLDIEEAARRARIIAAATDTKVWSERRRHMDAVARAAEKLGELLGNGLGPWCSRELLAALGESDHPALNKSPDDAGRTDGLRVLVDAIATTARSSLDRPALNGVPPLRREPSRGEWMIGVGLPPVFTKWFGKGAGKGSHFSRSLDQYTSNSPFIRFCEAVLADQMIFIERGPYKRSTIAREFARARSKDRPTGR